MSQDSQDFGRYNVRPFNRGNKLQSTGREPYNMNPNKPSMWAASHIDEQLRFSRQQQRRVIASKFYRQRIGKTVLERESPYYGINIEDYWGVLDNVQDVKHMKSAVDSLNSKELDKLSSTIMDMITEEKEKNKRLHKFVDLLINQPELETAQEDQDGMISEGESIVLLSSEFLSQSTEYLNRLTMIRNGLVDCIYMNRHLKKKLLETDDADEEIDDEKQENK